MNLTNMVFCTVRVGVCIKKMAAPYLGWGTGHGG